MGEIKKDTRYITVLSVLSSLAVVFLHTNGCFWGGSVITRGG